jgi:threonine/homoserine/homoserine lactone efflux protein
MLLALSILPFAVSTTVTPGPNNVMLAAFAANFGFRRTIPQMLGIAFGFPLMVAVIGLGLAHAFETYPRIHQILRVVGTIYLLFLAWKIAIAIPDPDQPSAQSRPMSFIQAALFQWVNPKAWIMAVSAITTYTTVHGALLGEVATITLVFAAISPPSSALWAGMGATASRLLKSPKALRRFNIAMAVLLVVSIIPILLD